MNYERPLLSTLCSDSTDDREGCLFTATVHPKEIAGAVEGTGLSETPGKSSGKTGEQILTILSERQKMTIPGLAEALGITTRGVEKQISKLRQEGLLRRVGPAKGGHWEVIEKSEG
jgi:ATP-dependent DNA helicase RecG